MFFPLLDVHGNLSVLFSQTIFSLFSFQHVHVPRKRIVVSLLMKLVFFQALEFLIESVLIFHGRFSVEILNECSLSLIELFGCLFGMSVQFGYIQLHLFSFLLNLFSLLFFLLEGLESDKFSDGREFRICKLWLKLRVKRHYDLSLLYDEFY